MIKHELEQLTGRRFTERQYDALEVLYNETCLEKQDFAWIIKDLIDYVPEPEAKREKKVVAMMDPMGNVISMNGGILACVAELMDVEINSGKTVLRMLPCSECFKDATDIELFSNDPKIVWRKWEG